MPARPALAAGAATALVLALSLTACGSDGKKPGSEPEAELSATPSSQVTTAPSSDAKVIAIKLSGDTVTPSGDKVEVKANQPIVLQINADKAGELHLHSSPEKHIEFPAGGSEITLKLAQPGVVDLEDHALDKLIVQLEVR
ncbi:hypothetical protein [Nocardioides marmorisolisilvae]|uniref:EfeO-type cupredoxin-like domain-containing protein n=1 Tax=Nocardioides marmorisolisilvae TaxID=1542737 RepID=A0A3N0DTC0_9ACTN|nr:hypothetical protein [Nocardioides marmorisolisilvae]RNL78653.1 hypothetical protein EFL95_06090 [Nocardioides marmorisolisilvae]